ncbi:glycosyltransferase [Geobacillus stearothermophilus]|uniref:glycosyltransferase family 4 protein n=1 Tax=Geobacillus stearothermophilus TaxID=1422 RepID=UPI001F2F9F5B|nr:glycosyltransferase [Geobacillus stearothermophilus]MCK7604891.1 glycosyltransferase [Geobacillus stearothermophilus]
MNVCLICINSSRSAIGDSFKNLCNNLSEKKNIYIIKSFCYNDSEFDYESHRILSINFDKRDKNIFKKIDSLLKIKKFIKENDIKHLFFYSDNPFNSLVKMLNNKIDYSFWWHDPKPHTGVKLLNKILFKINESVLLTGKKLNNIFVASNYLKELAEENPLTDSKKIKVIYLPYMEEITSLVQEEVPYDERYYDFIFFGRIEKYKGLDILEQALYKLHVNGIDYKALIVGPGNLNDCTNGLLMKLKDKVEIINKYVSNNELAKYISNSRVAVFPYRDSTGTQTVQTAIYLGCTVVATDTGSFKEYLSVKSPILGYVIKPNDSNELYKALLKCLGNHITHKNNKSTIDAFFNPKTMACNLYSAIHNKNRG